MSRCPKAVSSFIDILTHVSNIYQKNKKQVDHNSSAIKNALDKIYFQSTSTDYNLKDISSFAGEIYQQAFIEGLVYGDYSKEEAKESLQILKQG